MYPPGYGPPGAPPQPPGLFGNTMQAYGGNAGAIQAGGALFGGNVAGGLAAAPGMAYGAMGMVGMAAPFLMAGMQGLPGARWSAARAGVTAMDQLDPTTHLFRTAGAGWRAGFTHGGQVMGLGGLSRQGIGATFQAVRGAFAQQGMRAGLGLGARAMGAGAMGLAGGLAGAALPIGASMAIFGGLQAAGNQMRIGAQQGVYGQVLNNRMSTAMGGQIGGASAGTTGRMMSDMARDLGVGMEDVGRYAQYLDSQKLFQTTRSAKEFRDKFQEVMKTVKEVSKITQETVEEALQTFTEIRRQGFYSPSDIKTEATSRQARASATGISTDMYSAIASSGAQTARRYGMRGRFGARLAQRNVAGVSMGLRAGTMSEEEIMEMGGVEAVGLRMSQQQMGFLSTARGRAMIAYSMGQGGGPDRGRLGNLLGGASIESIVTGAAGRGLGVLSASGGREARENFAPYAGMAMITMAAAQQQQLYGGADRRGIIRMLGTMGVGREEAELMLESELGRPAQMRAERAAESTALTEAAYQDRRSREGVVRGVKDWAYSTYGRGLQGFGARVAEDAGSAYRSTLTRLSRSEVYYGGDEGLAREFVASGAGFGLRSGGGERRSLFGLRAGSATRGARQRYRGLGTVDASGMTSEEISRRTGAGGDLIDMGVEYQARTGGRFMRRSDAAAYDAGRATGAEGEGSEGLARMRLALRAGEGGSAVAREIGTQFGQAGALGIAGAFANVVTLPYVGTSLSALDASGNLQQVERESTLIAAAKMSGLVGNDFTVGDLRRMDPRARGELEGTVRRYLETAKSSGNRTESAAVARMLEGLSGRADSGDYGAKTLQEVRDTTERELKAAFKAEGLGVSGSMGLAETLATDGRARQAYTEYMRALTAGGDDEAVLAAEEALEGVLDPRQMRAVTQQRRQVERRRARGEDVSGLLGGMVGEGGTLAQQAAYETMDYSLRGIQRSASGVDLREFGGVSHLHSAATTLGQAGGTLDSRMRASSSIVRRALDDGTLGAEEIAFLDRVGGMGQGSKLSSMMSALREGDLGEADKEALSEAGIDFEAIAKMEDEGAQGQAIAEALKKLGYDNLATLSDEKRGTGRRGTQTAYVDANREFVQAVHQFLSAISGKVDGVDVFVGPSADLTGSEAGPATPGS
jgi:hypothetical protein